MKPFIEVVTALGPITIARHAISHIQSASNAQNQQGTAIFLTRSAHAETDPNTLIFTTESYRALKTRLMNDEA